MASAARKAAEAFVTSGHVWDGPTCIRAVEIITSLLAEQPEAGADPVRRFGLSVLAAWWDEGNPGDLGGDDLQDFAEHVGLWHRVERHADGVECEWCQNDGSGCGELTEAGDRAVREANDLPLRPAPSPARDEVREAAEEWAAAEAEYDAVPAYSRDTDAFARNMFRRQSARRRLLAALSRDAKGGEK